jgi:hypothetical protein
MTDSTEIDRDAIRRAAAASQVVGSAEYAAMVAETAAGAGGATESDLEGFTAETLGAAGCQEYLDALRLLSWRARGLSRALEFINVGGPRGTEDAMMLPILVTAAALADLVTASFVIRDPDSENSARDDAAASWRDAMRELSRLTGNEPVELATTPQHDHDHDHDHDHRGHSHG